MSKQGFIYANIEYVQTQNVVVNNLGENPKYNNNINVQYVKYTHWNMYFIPVIHTKQQQLLFLYQDL